ncbi:MAG: single-stranded-DNA-specific exonuclease RecJ [Myxococcales bacterium]|nr:single-stranded-DNA-specific exonuclease RecJ [Myxococcales bacterium]MCB9713747.1 single-stranded-DNA-specific exonuclease RecJ [Myxococcales bacterium]
MSTAAAMTVEAEPAERGPTLRLRGGGPDRAVVEAVAARLGLPLATAQLMLARGVQDESAQQRLLDPRLQHLRRPDAMAGFPEALALLETACREGWRVGVFGDYDVDGVTTATILTTFLEALGLQVVARVAQRSRGYGLGVPDAEAFVQARVQLLVTGDCGTSDLEALGWLRERGVPTVVIDHHQVPDQMPPCDALINPHQPGCEFPFKGMCSAGVAFYLCAALRTRLSEAGRRTLPDPRAWLDLVALATVCDMMPLQDENRVLVTHGLRTMERRMRPGLRALMRATGADPRDGVDETVLGFRLGPRLNAPGRLGPAEPSLRLLRASTEAEAMPLAEQIETLNARRKRHQQETVAQALALLVVDPQLERRAALVVAHDGWLPGVVGIAAAGVAEHHRRPALVLAIDRQAGVARGSVRSYGGVDVRAALAECEEHLVRFGGHREAAGATVALPHLDDFSEAFDQAVARQLRDAPRDDEEGEVVDAVLPLLRIDESLVEAMARLRPYGVGFPPPRYACEGAVVDRVRVLKDKHLQLTLRQGEERRDAIAFGQAHHGLRTGEAIGCIFVPQVETFRGQRRLRLHVERLWRMT